VRGLPIMHDPLAVATLIDPNLVQWRRGTATVELQGAQTYGYTLFQKDDEGPHEHAYEVNVDAALDLWISKVLAY
jgi:inosine-uridine nucleoside N-ribohydrolase